MGRHQKFSPALIVPSPALIVPLPVYRFPNKLAPKVPNNIPRNPPFCSFVSLAHFINNPDSSRDLTIFMIAFISSLKVRDCSIITSR